MAPLILLIVIGYLSGKLLKIKEYSLISKLILYVFTPIVAFNAISNVESRTELFILPVIFLATTSGIALFYKFALSRLVKTDSKLINTLAYSAGSGNVAFYGVPAVLILLGEEFLPIILISMIGYIIYDSSVGYLIMTGQKFDLKGIIVKLLKFPPFIAIILGLLFLLLRINLSGIATYQFIVQNSQTTMATLGIFLIGLAVSNLKISIDYFYLLAISIAKVVINPLLILLILLFDKYTLGIFTNYANTLVLIASVPVATNSVILATQFTQKEQIASLGVLVIVILSIISIPLWQLIVDALI